MSQPDPIELFRSERSDRVRSYDGSKLSRAADQFLLESTVPKYCYNFEFLGRPIIQYPQDMVAMQELVWKVKPDLIIETGIAHGGSLIMNAAMQALIDYCTAAERGETLDPSSPSRMVLGIDVDIRPHNREAIEKHAMSTRIKMIEGSSVDEDVVSETRRIAAGFERVLVCLDSNHTHDHVLSELHAYAGLVSVGSYCVVFDTVVEDLPDGTYPDRPWGPGDNPKTAVHRFLEDNDRFEIDRDIDAKLQISVAPDGFLKRIS